MDAHKANGIFSQTWIILILWLICAAMFWHPEPAPLAQLPSAPGATCSTNATCWEGTQVVDGVYMSARVPRLMELSLRTQTTDLPKHDLYSHQDVSLPQRNAHSALWRWVSAETPPLARNGFASSPRSPPLAS